MICVHGEAENIRSVEEQEAARPDLVEISAPVSQPLKRTLLTYSVNADYVTVVVDVLGIDPIT